MAFTRISSAPFGLQEQRLLEDIQFAIDQATSNHLDTTSWVANMQCVYLINPLRKEDLLLEVSMLLCRKLTSENGKIVFLTLRLLETLMNNCTRPWWGAINDVRVTDTILSVARKFLKSPDTGGEGSEVLDLCLDIIQDWFDTFSSRRHQFPNIIDLHRTLQEEGFPFKNNAVKPKVAEGNNNHTSHSEQTAAINNSKVGPISDNTFSGFKDLPTPTRRADAHIQHDYSPNSPNFDGATLSSLSYDSETTLKTNTTDRTRATDISRISDKPTPARESAGKVKYSNVSPQVNVDLPPVPKSLSATKDLINGFSAALMLFKDLMLAAKTNHELRSAEIAEEMLGHLEQMHTRVSSAIIECVDANDTSSLDILIQLNDGAPVLLDAYKGVLNNSLSIKDAHSIISKVNIKSPHSPAGQKPPNRGSKESDKRTSNSNAKSASPSPLAKKPLPATSPYQIDHSSPSIGYRQGHMDSPAVPPMQNYRPPMPATDRTPPSQPPLSRSSPPQITPPTSRSTPTGQTMNASAAATQQNYRPPMPVTDRTPPSQPPLSRSSPPQITPPTSRSTPTRQDNVRQSPDIRHNEAQRHNNEATANKPSTNHYHDNKTQRLLAPSSSGDLNFSDDNIIVPDDPFASDNLDLLIEYHADQTNSKQVHEKQSGQRTLKCESDSSMSPFGSGLLYVGDDPFLSDNLDKLIQNVEKTSMGESHDHHYNVARDDAYHSPHSKAKASDESLSPYGDGDQIICAEDPFSPDALDEIVGKPLSLRSRVQAQANVIAKKYKPQVPVRLSPSQPTPPIHNPSSNAHTHDRPVHRL